jgi:multidrug efflux pump subunit AcrB
MRLSEICVKRPVFAFMLIMFLVVLGVSSFTQLGVDLFPRSDPATVNVKVDLPGASPEEVTSQVVMPLEEAIASVSGVDEMQARISEGTANITVTFVLERNISDASDDVREKVSGAMRNLQVCVRRAQRDPHFVRLDVREELPDFLDPSDSLASVRRARRRRGDRHPLAAKIIERP